MSATVLGSDSARRWKLPELSIPPPTARELDDISAAARTEGRAEGYAQGLEEARALAQRLSSMVGQLAQPLAAADAEVERLLVGLSLQIGSQLALRELQADPEALAAIVREAVSLLTPPPREVRVHLHPQDLAAVQGLLDRGGTAHWQLQADAKLARGDCVVETEAASVDARLRARAAEIARQLFGET